MNPTTKGRFVFFLLALLQILVVLFVQSAGAASAFMLWPYLALTLLNLLQFLASRSFEDASPQAFLGAAIGVTAAIALFSVIGPEPDRMQSWYATPMANPNFLTLLTGFAPVVVRALSAIGYVLTTVSLTGILRTLERRPSQTLLFALNPVVLLLLIHANVVFIPLACITASFHFLLKQKWWLAYLFLGVGLGVSILAVAILPFFVKHHLAHVEREQRRSVFALTAIFVIAALASSLPLANISWVFGEGWLGTSWIVVGLLILATSLTIVLWLRAEVAGRDTALYAILLALTFFTVASLDLSMTMLLLLLPLASVYRSLPQLWLIFAAGLLHALHVPYGAPLASAIAGGIFLLLFALQGRHALRETGLFRTIEMQEGAV